MILVESFMILVESYMILIESYMIHIHQYISLDTNKIHDSGRIIHDSGRIIHDSDRIKVSALLWSLIIGSPNTRQAFFDIALRVSVFTYSIFEETLNTV